ncbi:hypothetical protein [Ramlibacter algicola]|uniref:DUF2169 domain-containing protein n=1 Tax=Ramlibacter algicola TaxID=2795217 RepID=A0A934PZ95_9BURK|nr:hypothetical protein [Ramlibacter algicola]MBK0391394.1 hypothetical protein [Ramlibacter algicola]
MRPLFKPALLAAVAASALGAHAQGNVKPPKVQLWMDVSTGGMAGMPELPAGMGAMGGMFGGGRGGDAATTYGQARGLTVMPPRVLDIALLNTLRPGQEAQQLIPAGMRMGDSLPLVPPKVEPTPRGEPGTAQDMPREKPKGRVLVYWGCGAEVRKGQPRVIDLARGNPADYAAAFAGRYAPDRGARVTPQYALYPNEKNHVQLARDSSLVGEHRIQGEGIPASMRFTLAAAQDLMPAIELQAKGDVKDSVPLSWKTVPNARAYYLQAMGQVGDDLVLWSSAETGDTGMGLFDYLPNATIDRWVKESVLLKPDVTSCAVPKGIFAGSEGAMTRMMAYGSESNFAHPPRPADPKAAWAPEWAVRVRVKASTMAMLGQDTATAQQEPQQQQQQPGAPADPVQGAVEGLGGAAGAAGAVLKGLFGR